MESAASDDLATRPGRLARAWPWLLLALSGAVALWHAVDFPDDVDPEFPGVVRPNFSPLPPPAYRLAEPGDTIDRVSIYVSAIAIVLVSAGLKRDKTHRRHWLTALAVASAAFWLAANPSPTFDGWHGLGWAVLADSSAPMSLRLTLGAGATSLSAIAIWGSRGWLGRLPELWERLRARRVGLLMLTALVLVVLRILNWPRVEPAGYWPRWALVGALMAFCAVLIRLMPSPEWGRRHNLRFLASGAACWYLLVWSGIWLTWYHRPLDRLRAVTPGKIYISAMPTSRGLEIAQGRHHFKTIINLFPENTPLRSPRLSDELAFAKTHDIRYVGSPSEVSASNDFLDLTLRLAQDPDAWPILVHCHACMDRTPAWAGIYRYVVEGWKLDDVFRFIESHRGLRPKGSVVVLYNRVLPRVAPERAANDPTLALLRRCAEGTVDPYYRQLREEQRRVNPKDIETLEQADQLSAAARLPSLTHAR